MKKFISLLLVFSVLALSMPLTAKERKGADLIIQKTDGTQVRGELIAVKQTSLLLMERESGADVTIDIEEVSVIRIVKKSKALLGGGLGLLVFGGTSFGVALIRGDFDVQEPEVALAICAIIGGIGALIGGLMGFAAGRDEKIQFEGKAKVQIQSYLERLRKKARVRNAQ